MSNVLSRITGKNDKMKQSIDRAQETMNKSTNYAKNLSYAEQKLELLGERYNAQRKLVQRLNEEYLKSIEIRGRNAEKTEALKRKALDAHLAEIRLAESVEKAGKKLEEQDNRIKNNIDSSGGLIKRIKQLAGAYISFRTAKKLLKDTVGAAGELNQRVAVMQAAFGNANIGKHYFNRLQLYAIETRNDIEDLTNVTRNFMQLTRNTDKLMGLTDVANRLSMRTSNLGSAENLMQEAMRGEFTRLQRTLHLTDSQIEPLKQAVQKGSLDGIISAFDQALNTAGLTDEIKKAYQDNPLQKFHKAIDRVKLGFARAGEEALMRLEPVFDKINNWLQSASADQFFGAIAAGVSMIVNGVIWLTETVSNNWDIIQPILVAIATVYLVSIISKLWATIPPLLLQAKAWLAINWPILVAAGAVWIFIGILMQAGVTAGQITGFIAGSFSLMGAILHNVFAFILNVGIRTWELIANAVNDPIYYIEKAFYNMALGILNIFNRMLIAISNKINIAIDAMNKLPFANFDKVDFNINGKISRLESMEPQRNKDKIVYDRIEYKNLAESYHEGYNWGKQIPDKFKTGLGSIENAIANFGAQEDMWNGAQTDTLGKLDDTGKKIKNSVDKSNEDLKWMRDLAEQEVINRFTTATLAPQISIEFGDVKETADVDGIVDHLETILTEQLNIAAEGVHE